MTRLLCLCSAHTSFCWFCHVVAEFTSIMTVQHQEVIDTKQSTRSYRFIHHFKLHRKLNAGLFRVFLIFAGIFFIIALFTSSWSATDSLHEATDSYNVLNYIEWFKTYFQTRTIWTASSEFGTYRLCEQRRFRRACASAQSRQNLRCSLIQAVSQEEPSDRKPDPWPLWMAGHAQLKLVVTECSKTQIRLTGLIWY